MSFRSDVIKNNNEKSLRSRFIEKSLIKKTDSPKSLNYLSFFSLLIISFFCLKCFSANITVAIIDTGADINHSLIVKNLWTNPGEIPDNGIDDDQNGYIDDIHGWNFSQSSANVRDLHGHGTHIAGIVAQNAPSAKIMVLKYFDPKSSAEKNLESTIEAIQYATKMGAHIVNYSAGGPGYNGKEEGAIRKAQEKNILFVAAAGNDSRNTDISKYYPANYALSNILSVLSLNNLKEISSFSNYGPQSIDIATIGEDILSAAPGDQMSKMSGSSQATAIITAAAANLLAQSHGAWAEEISSRLKQSGDLLSSLKNKSKYEKYFDASLLNSIKSSSESAYGERWANMVDISLSEVLVPSP